jgi:hypothetical protein
MHALAVEFFCGDCGSVISAHERMDECHEWDAHAPRFSME